MNHAEVSDPQQQPCTHCGACAPACPAHLQPQRLFAALAGDDWEAVRRGGLASCVECNRCTEVCPSHIPLLDWLHWGKAELRARNDADAARSRFTARAARLAGERGRRAARRAATNEPAAPVARTISRAEVLAAIGRGRARRARKRDES